jgi:hypothetical protein
MLEVVVLVLSILLFVTFAIIGHFWRTVDSLNSKISELKSEVKKVEEVTNIEVGDKALIPDFGLTNKQDNENFTVDYEVEILEVSTDQVKVKALSYTSLDNFAKDPQNRQSIINFLQATWISKRDIQLIVDDQMRREKKLNQLGI